MLQHAIIICPYSDGNEQMKIIINGSEAVNTAPKIVQEKI